jgi:hypothetical protein
MCIGGDLNISGIIANTSTKIRIGSRAGESDQQSTAIAIGDQAGTNSQSLDAIAIGHGAGYSTQGTNSIAIGLDAGYQSQGAYNIAIGTNSGNLSQGLNAIAIGNNSGKDSQQGFNIAIGESAAENNQFAYAIALGYNAGQNSQFGHGIAIGRGAGQDSQKSYGIAIGRDAGNLNQGAGAIAVGYRAGINNQHANTIILNASQLLPLDSTSEESTYINPLRNATTDNTVYYNSSTKEITYGPTNFQLYPVFTFPPTTDFTLMNWDSQPTFTDESNRLLSVGGRAAAGTWFGGFIYNTALPSPPYTIDYSASQLGNPNLQGRFSTGIILRQSDNGYCINYACNCRTDLGLIPSLNIFRATGWVGYGGDTTYSPYFIDPNVMNFRVTDDGVNRKFYYSRNARDYILIQTDGNTDFLTADQVGFLRDDDAGPLSVYNFVVT